MGEAKTIRRICGNTAHREAAHGEAADLDAVDLLGAGFVLIRPCDVVIGAGRQDFDVGVMREVFGDVTGVKLRAAVNALAHIDGDDVPYPSD